jgi:hypothetical protein
MTQPRETGERQPFVDDQYRRISGLSSEEIAKLISWQFETEFEFFLALFLNLIDPSAVRDNADPRNPVVTPRLG